MTAIHPTKDTEKDFLSIAPYRMICIFFTFFINMLSRTEAHGMVRLCFKIDIKKFTDKTYRVNFPPQLHRGRDAYRRESTRQSVCAH